MALQTNGEGEAGRPGTNDGDGRLHIRDARHLGFLDSCDADNRQMQLGARWEKGGTEQPKPT